MITAKEPNASKNPIEPNPTVLKLSLKGAVSVKLMLNFSNGFHTL
jgi:hypothetical protein